MAVEGATSPTLTLRVQSLDAQEQVAKLRGGLALLKQEVAGFNSAMKEAKEAVGGLTALQAKIRELENALKTSQAEIGRLSEGIETQARRSTRAIKEQTDAAVTGARAVRDETQKTTAVVQKAAAGDEEKLRPLSVAETALARLTGQPISSKAPATDLEANKAASLLALQNELGLRAEKLKTLGLVHTAEMAQLEEIARLSRVAGQRTAQRQGLLGLRPLDISETAFAQLTRQPITSRPATVEEGFRAQSLIASASALGENLALREQERQARIEGVRQSKAITENEVRERLSGITQFRAIQENETRDRQLGVTQFKAIQDNEVRDRQLGVTQSKAIVENEVRDRQLGVAQAKALQENELRERTLGVAQSKALQENEVRDRQIGVSQSKALIENEVRDRQFGVAQSKAIQDNEVRDRQLGVAQFKATQDNEIRDRQFGVAQSKALIENEVRDRQLGVTQSKALIDNEIRSRTEGVTQSKAILENERRDRLEETRLRKEGVEQSRAEIAERKRALRDVLLNQRFADASPERRVRIAERAAEVIGTRGLTEGDAVRQFGSVAVENSNAAALERLRKESAEATAAAEALRKAKTAQTAAINANTAAIEANEAALARDRRLNAQFFAATPASQLARAQGAATLLAQPGSTPQEAVRAFGTAAVSNSDIESINRLRVAKDAATAATQRFTESQRDLHGVARGLTGALGALWLTYGSTVPIVAGFAIASALREAVKAGAEFQYQMTFVKQVSGESAGVMGLLSESILNLSTRSLFKPLELAEGMRVLVQAGFSARDAFAALPSVMDLAIAGELKMEQASLTLAGAMNAFGLTVKDIPHIGDVIAKAAAVSQTSVSQLTESLKQASTVAEQYNVDIETVMTSLVQLAKVNIVGSAAGTSVKNFFADLGGRNPRQLAAQKELGVSFFDAKGQTRDTFDVIADLRKALAPFNEKAQFSFLKDLFDERGAKAALNLLREFDSELRKTRDDLKTSDGFMRSIAVELETTAKGEFQKAGSALSAAFIRSFNESEGALKDFALTLREVFSSSEFQSGLNALLSGFAALTQVLVENGRVIVTLIELYAGFKIFQGLSALVSGAAGAFTQLSVAQRTTISTTSALAAINAGSTVTALGQTAVLAAGGISSVGAAATASAGGVAGLIDMAKKGGTELNNLSNTQAPERLNAVGRAVETVGGAMAGLARGASVLARIFGIGGILYVAIEALIAVYDKLAGAKNRANQKIEQESRSMIQQVRDQNAAAEERLKLLDKGIDPKDPEAAQRGRAQLQLESLQQRAEEANREKAEAQKAVDELRAKTTAAAASSPLAAEAALRGGAQTAKTSRDQLAAAEAKLKSAEAAAADLKFELDQARELKIMEEKSQKVNLPTVRESALKTGGFDRPDRPDNAAAKLAQRLANAEVQDEFAKFRRQEQELNQTSQFQLQMLDMEKRFNLVREEEYQESVDRITSTRLKGLVDLITEEQAVITQKLNDPRITDDKKVTFRTKLEDSEARKLRAQAEADQFQALRNKRIEGEGKQREREVSQFSKGLDSDRNKLVEQQELEREQKRAAVERQVLPEDVAVRQIARLETEKVFLSQIESIKKEINKLEGEEHLTEKQRLQLQILREKLPLLEEEREKQAQLNEEQAVAIYEMQRSFEYGWAKAFKSYVEQATSAAQRAAEVFGLMTKTMEDALFEFATTGHISWKKLADDFTKEMARINVKQAVAELQKGFPEIFGGLARILGRPVIGSSTGAGTPPVVSPSGGGIVDTILTKLGIIDASPAKKIAGGIPNTVEQVKKEAAVPLDVFGPEGALKPTVDLTKAQDDFGSALDRVADDFETSVDSMMESFSGSFSQALGQVLSTLTTSTVATSVSGGGGLGGILGGLFGSSSVPVINAPAVLGTPSINSVLELGSILPFHTGGMVGTDRPQAPRAIDMRLFSGAPRFHTGGIIGEAHRVGAVNPSFFIGAPRMHSGGIAANEVPIIAQRGEGIFTPAQMRNLAPVGQQQPSVNQTTNHNTVQVQVNVPRTMDRPSAEHLAARIGVQSQRAIKRSM